MSRPASRTAFLELALALGSTTTGCAALATRWETVTDLVARRSPALAEGLVRRTAPIREDPTLGGEMQTLGDLLRAAAVVIELLPKDAAKLPRLVRLVREVLGPGEEVPRPPTGKGLPKDASAVWARGLGVELHGTIGDTIPALLVEPRLARARLLDVLDGTLGRVEGPLAIPKIAAHALALTVVCERIGERQQVTWPPVTGMFPTLDELFTPERTRGVPKGLLVHVGALKKLLAPHGAPEHASRPITDGLPPMTRVSVAPDGVVTVGETPRVGRPSSVYVMLHPEPTGFAVREYPLPGPLVPCAEAFLRFAAGTALQHVLDEGSRLREILEDEYATTPAARLVERLRLIDGGASAEPAKASSTLHERLTWLVTPFHDVVEVTERGFVEIRVAPVTEALGKKGEWRAPKVHSAHSVMARAPVTFPDDYELLAAVAAHETWQGTSRVVVEKLVRTLARRGGPDGVEVFTTAGPRAKGLERARFRVTRPALVVDDSGDALGFRFAIGRRRLGADDLRRADQGLFVVDPGVGAAPTTIHYVATPPAVGALVDALAQAGGALHATDGERHEIATHLARLAGTALDVELPVSLEGDTRPPPAAATALLARREDGTVRLKLGHKALPGGKLLLPDTGPDRALGVVDGIRCVVTRDREAERARLFAIEQALALEEEDATGPGVFTFVDVERALAVVEALHDLTRPAPDGATDRPRVIVEWSEGVPFVPHAPVEGNRIKIAVRGFDHWIGVDGGATVDGTRVALHRLLIAARDGARYVTLDDGRFLRLADALRDELARLAALARVEGDVVELGIAGAPLLDGLAAQGAEVVEEEGTTLQDLKARLHLIDASPAKVPSSFQGTLRPYQVEGFQWLMRLAAWGTGGCLADEMGLGKTPTALAVLAARRRGGPALVVAPLSVIPNWERELARFTPELRVVVRTSAQAPLRGVDAADTVVLTTYGVLARDAALAEVAFHTAVFDEAQALKNQNTQRAQAAQKLNATWAFALTGTPVENHLGELWSIFETVSPGTFGEYEYFSRTWIIPIERHKDAARRRALSRAIRPFILRRRKRDVALELPPKTEITVPIVSSDDERAFYEAVRAHEEEIVREAMRNGEDARFLALAAITRLRLTACHPKLYDRDTLVPSSKLERVMETVRALVDAERRLLVFSQFTKHLDLVEAALVESGIAFVRLDGSTALADRARRVERFQAGEVPVFLISLRAGGTGINLTRADDVLHLDPWWNPAVEDQATDRAHRIGQDKPVTVHRFIIAGSIEEKILALHDEKRALVDDLLAEADGAARLGMDDLLRLLGR